ncbi:MAG: dihydroorotate dehydrogenase electron transfer subunit [Gammaproteobacteria bacterium]|nr:dihydroorotate dehydrogenase electron transfer subunit [Gammaproteobacteria bacterium]
MNDKRTHRNTIFVEEAEVLQQQVFDGQQFILRVHAPQCAARAQPGTFAHLTCDPAVPMRRPLSIMRANASEGWIEFLYKIVGDGLRHLASRRPGDTLSVMGPIGQPFRASSQRPRPVLIGGGVGIPPMVFFSEWLHRDDDHDWQPMVFMGSELPFPFTVKPSTIVVPGIPDGVIGCMPLLDDWGIPSRLASLSGFAGCYDGFVTTLADHWLMSLPRETLGEIELFACGPTPMLRAAAALAKKHELPCQVSLEEFMACAVGGCAGCVVEVRTADGPAMKRVCVDGPVFDAYSVF